MDADFSLVTFNCLYSDLAPLLENGFNTGHGFIRPPRSIRAAASLACVSLQSSQNDCFGGQSLIGLDYVLAPYVDMSFKKHLKNAINTFNAFNAHASYKPEKYKEHDDIVQECLDIIDNIKYYDPKDVENREYMKCKISSLYEGSDLIKTEKIYNITCKTVEEETHQAMEALVFNLNTLHSRCGSQVPFSSINLGMNTAPEGRLIIKEFLNATWNGLGNGETPLFPISVWLMKEGVNYNPGDPNYDLFKYAMKVSAKRLYPNFLNIDSSFNLPYYKADDYRTHASAMGCADGDEVVLYNYRGQQYCEGFKRLWDKVSCDFPVKEEGISDYVNTSGLTIWDGDNGFVEVKTVVRNPDQNNWVRITFNNGRSILVTEDHPLYTENKGRIFTSNLVVGDSIKTYWNLPIGEDDYSTITESKAYILGLLLVDGCYDKQLTVTLDTRTEQDVSARFIDCVRDVWDKNCTVTHFNRGDKGVYDSISVDGGYTDGISSVLTEIFGGLQKNNRKIPDSIFRAPRNIKMAFMAGMVDGDGHISYKSKVQLGSVNKELSLQQLALAQSLGIPAKIYLNHYNSADMHKLRYRVEYSMTEELAGYLASGKKANDQWNGKISNTIAPDIIKVKTIEYLGYLGKCSYDVETSTDHFTLSFINSGNCRTRVMSNVNGPEITSGRGNFAFTTINLPYLALQACRNLNRQPKENNKEVIDEFFKLFDKYIYLGKEYLEWRFNIIAKKEVKNFPFVMGQHLYMGSEKLGPTDEIRPALLNASISIGYVGLAECLVALTGKHHGESKEAQELGLSIVKHLRDATDNFTEETHLNWSTFATPAEGFAGTSLRGCRAEFGIIPGITDREYLTNSHHCPVYYQMKAIDKIKTEAPYNSLANAGSITYIEMDGDPLKNLPAFEKLVRAMHDNDLGYYAISHAVDRDPICGYTGIIANECPHCHRREDGRYRFKVKKYENND